LLLGPSAGAARRLGQIASDPDRYVSSRFAVATREKGGDFTEWAAKILAGIPRMPSFISFYLLLNARDSPIRIDVPCWEHPLSKTGWPKPADLDLQA
jgi:hypothetical protein